MTERGFLLAVHPDGSTNTIDNRYESIRDAVGGHIDFAFCNDQCGFFVHDEGILMSFPLNVPASIIGGRALYGSAVLTNGVPDDEGDTMPPDELTKNALEAACRAWRSVLDSARFIGQNLTVLADPDTLPPPQIMPLPDNWLPGDPMPGPV